jgi:hypothetical protein
MQEPIDLCVFGDCDYPRRLLNDAASNLGAISATHNESSSLFGSCAMGLTDPFLDDAVVTGNVCLCSISSLHS